MVQCVENRVRASFLEVISLAKIYINQDHNLYISLFFMPVEQNKVPDQELSTINIDCLTISYNNEFKQMLSKLTSTPNCSGYLKLGVILVICEIRKRRLVYFYNINQHMMQNTQFLQLSMLKINNVYWSNEIANYIILFNLVKPEINEVFILSFEKLKKHFVHLLNLMSRKT